MSFLQYAPEGKAKAEYGKFLIKELSEKLTRDFGKGYTITNLKNMRQFYMIFPIGYAVCSQLEKSDKTLIGDALRH